MVGAAIGPPSEVAGSKRRVAGWLAEGGERLRSTWRTGAGRREVVQPALQRAVRAAIVVPLAFALGKATGDAQTAIFAAFGAFALLLLVELSGRPAVRLRGFVALVGVGAVLIVVGTLCSQEPAIGVPVTAVIVFGILFFSVTSPMAAEATTSVLLFLVLPVAVPAAPAAVGSRLEGVAIAAALAVPAAMLLWPPKPNNALRLRMAEAAEAVATLVAGGGDEKAMRRAHDDLSSAAAGLRSTFQRSATLPGGLAPGDHLICRLVGHFQWMVGQALRLGPATWAGGDGPGEGGDGPGASGLDRLRRAMVEQLARSSEALRQAAARGVPEPATVEALKRAVDEVASAREAGLAEAIERMTTAAEANRSPSSPRTRGWLDRELGPCFRIRALTCAMTTVGEDMLALAAARRLAAAEPLWRRGRDYLGRVAVRLRSYARLDSVWVRNSARGAVGVSLAVLVAEVTKVQHGFWVVLGLLSVLRSTAAGTRSTALRAVGGTVIGVVVGSLVVVGVGDHSTALWLLLPVSVLVAGAAPMVASFAAGQAAFTVVILLLFNIVQPGGWKVGLIRLEDVSLGCAVAVVVGVALWPRGGARLLARHLCATLAASARFLRADVFRFGAARPVPLEERSRAAAEASRLLDDAFRDYLLGGGAGPLPADEVTPLVVQAVHAQLSGEELAMLPGGEEPSADRPAIVGRATEALAGAFDEVGNWYDRLRHDLAGRQAPADRALADPEPHPLLDSALDEASRTGRPELTRAVIRLLWAEEELDCLAELEAPLLRTARLLGRTASAGAGRSP